jgi:hypothetical protein
LVLASEDGSGGCGWSESFTAAGSPYQTELGVMGREGQKNGLNRPLCLLWEGNAENTAGDEEVILDQLKRKYCIVLCSFFLHRYVDGLSKCLYLIIKWNF